MMRPVLGGEVPQASNMPIPTPGVSPTPGPMHMDDDMGGGGMMMMQMTFSNALPIQLLWDWWNVTAGGSYALAWFICCAAGCVRHLLARLRHELVRANRRVPRAGGGRGDSLTDDSPGASSPASGGAASGSGRKVVVARASAATSVHAGLLAGAGEAADEEDAAEAGLVSLPAGSGRIQAGHPPGCPHAEEAAELAALYSSAVYDGCCGTCWRRTGRGMRCGTLRRSPFFLRLADLFLYGAMATVAFLNMLVVMAYNPGLFMAVVAGEILGVLISEPLGGLSMPGMSGDTTSCH